MKAQHNRCTGTFLVPLLVLFALVLSPPACADDSYYMIVFAAQRPTNAPRFTHTFATFVKATSDDREKGDPKIEEHTISWLPKSKEVVLARARPEPGVNLSRSESIKLAAELEEEVSMWGPFEIKKELYDRASKQIERLEDGKVQYKALDGRLRPESASNCIHAVSDIDGDNGLLDTGTTCGIEASRMVANHLRRWIIKPEKKHDWLSKRLDMNEKTVALRNWDE